MTNNKTKNSEKTTFILTALLMLLPLAVGVVLWKRLPDTVATHFGFDGRADGYSSKAFVVFGLPFILLAVHLICAAAVFLDPLKENVISKIKELVLWICPAVSVFVYGMVYAYALGYDIDIVRLSLLFIGLVYIIVGNYLPKCRQNHTIGIRLPWTLSDAENWNKTHRLAGKLWVSGGAVILLAGFSDAKMIIFAAVTVLLVFIPVLYSAVLCKKQAKQR